jgi:hypothetical protein
MFIRTSRSRAVCALLLATLTGCVSPARYVAVDGNSGVVAMPDNSDSWPCYNRRHAEELMKKKFPEGYVIDKEEEVVVGQTQFTNRNQQTTGNPLLAALYVAPVVDETHETTTYHDQKEWRIYFRKANAPAPVPVPTSPQSQ